MRASWLRRFAARRILRRRRPTGNPPLQRAANLIRVPCPSCGPVMCPAGVAQVTVEATTAFCDLTCPVCHRALRVPVTDQATLMLLAGEVQLREPMISTPDEQLAGAAETERMPRQRDREF